MYVQINCLILFGWVPIENTYTLAYTMGIIVFASVLNVIIARFPFSPPAVARSTHSLEPREEGAGVGRPVQRKVYRQGTGPALATKKSGSTDDRKWVVHYNLCWDESKRNPFIFDSFVLSTQREKE